MLIFPAIDLVGGKAVRLLRGDYAQMTVYNNDPVAVAKDFAAAGATHIHLVDLEGAKDDGTPNLETILKIKSESGLFCEVGGGIRSLDIIARYLDSGIDRVILGTAAVTDTAFLRRAVSLYGNRIAVGVDIRDGCVAIRGWKETAPVGAFAFIQEAIRLGAQTFICTDISKDGAMQGTNFELYRRLTDRFSADFIASGGVSSLDDVRELTSVGVHAAIIGKAYYTGAIDLAEAVRIAEKNEVIEEQ